MLDAIVAAFRDRAYLVTGHTLDRAHSRNLDIEDVGDGMREDAPEIIEDYPDDPRGPSCLVLCQSPHGDDWYHIVCTHPPDVRLITVYRPDADRWSDDLRRRLR